MTALPRRTKRKAKKAEKKRGTVPFTMGYLAANPPKEPSKAALRRERLLANHKAGKHKKRSVNGCPKCNSVRVRSVVSSAIETNRRRH